MAYGMRTHQVAAQVVAQSPKATRTLVAAFAVVCGFTGIVVHATWYGRFSLNSGIAGLVGATSGAIAGMIMGRRRATPRSWPHLVAMVTSFTAVTWLFLTYIGTLSPVRAVQDRLIPTAVGTASPLLALVGLLFVLSAYRAALRPRPQSFLAGWTARRPWIATAAMCGLVASIAGQLQPGLRTGALLALGAAALTVFVAWLRDRRDARRLRSAAQAIDRRVEEPDPNEWDLGEGDERWLCAVGERAPYRSADGAGRVIRGSLLPLLQRLESAAFLDLCILAAALGAFAYLVLAVVPPREDVVARDYPVAPQPVGTPATTETPSNLSWYPQQTPILTDINGDGVEDIVGLRWDNEHPEASLAISANDGKTLRLLWTTERVPCQWASVRMHLVLSGSRLFLSDSEGLVHVYAVGDGASLGEPIRLLAREMCVPEGNDGSVWVLDSDDWSKHDDGVLVDASGASKPAKRPKNCATSTFMRSDGATVDSKCARRAPKDHYSLGLIKGDAGVRLERVNDSDPLGARVTGFDPMTCRQTWQSRIAFTEDALHRESRLSVQLSSERLVAFYQLEDGRWLLGARSTRDGAAQWHREPPRAHFGTDFQSLTLTSQRVYLCLNWRLEVFDPSTGDSLGVVW